MLLPYALEAVNDILNRTDAKTRILVMGLVRRRLATYERMAEKIDHLETILFDKKRIDFMPQEKMAQLYAIAVKRETDAARQAIEAQKAKETLTIEEMQILVNTVVNPNVEPKLALAPEPAQKVFDAVTKLANMVARKQSGVVAEPPP